MEILLGGEARTEESLSLLAEEAVGRIMRERKSVDVGVGFVVEVEVVETVDGAVVDVEVRRGFLVCFAEG